MTISAIIGRVRRNTLGDALRRAAIRHHDRIALIYGERSWSFPALDRAVDRVAWRLTDLGLVPGDRVAAFGRNSDAYLIAFLACARAGLIHVPVNYALTGSELAYILGQSGARLVLSAPALEPHLDGIDMEMRGRFEGGGDSGCAGDRGRPGCAGRRGPGHHRRIDRADRLYLRHHGGAEGRDDDAPGDADANTRPASTNWTTPRTIAASRRCRCITRRRCTPSPCRRC